MDTALVDLFNTSAGPIQQPTHKPIDRDTLSFKRKSLQKADTSPVLEKRKKRNKIKRDRNEVLLEDLHLSRLIEPQKKSKSTAKNEIEESVTSYKRPENEEIPSANDDEHLYIGNVQEHMSMPAENNPDTSVESNLTSTNPIHESFHRRDEELEKAKATVFVGNLPTSVVTSSVHYKSLKSLFSAYGNIKSIRFRSIAFSELLPRKVAFLKEKFHPERDTLNAYIVFTRLDEARQALNLNGHHFLQLKHIRVDSVTHPAAHINKKCVFIGSLPFDAEDELLWNHFAIAGPIESVRIVRDNKTNVGRGFAYVQFKDVASVQNALLLDDKKMSLGEGKGFRKLRVSKALSTPSKYKADRRERERLSCANLKPRDKAKLGRVKSLMGSQAAAKLKILQSEIAIEGKRAQTPDGQQIKKRKKKSQKGVLRSKLRASAFRRANAEKGPSI